MITISDYNFNSSATENIIIAQSYSVKNEFFAIIKQLSKIVIINVGAMRPNLAEGGRKNR